MKIAGVQMDVKIGQIEQNLSAMIDRLAESRRHGAELTIFPECAVTGYCFDSLEEARQYAEQIPGEVTETMTAACRGAGGYAIFGMIEVGPDDGVFNAAVMVGPEGVLGSYRKIHLPFLGVDQFGTFGDRPFAVQAAGEVNVGLNICYDSAFPESSRDMSIQGADLIALPTNWPPGAENVAPRTQSILERWKTVSTTRPSIVSGTNGDTTSSAKSIICGPTGDTLAQADHRNEEILYAEIDPTTARMKRVVRVPGKHSIDRLADRRPEMYSRLVEPHDMPRPGREA